MDSVPAWPGLPSPPLAEEPSPAAAVGDAVAASPPMAPDPALVEDPAGCTYGRSGKPLASSSLRQSGRRREANITLTRCEASVVTRVAKVRAAVLSSPLKELRAAAGQRGARGVTLCTHLKRRV
jgi:hypothetical protein